MRKILTSIVAAGTLAAALAMPTAADARRGWVGPAIGGLAAGAIIGGALAPRPYYDGYAYGPGPAYSYDTSPAPYGYYNYYESSDPCYRKQHGGDRHAPCGN